MVAAQEIDPDDRRSDVVGFGQWPVVLSPLG